MLNSEFRIVFMWFNFMDHHRHFSFYGYFSESVHKNIVVHHRETVKYKESI